MKQNGDSQLNDLCLDGDALRFIKNYEWHSNVRQLHHVLMLSALNANFEKRNAITADDLAAQLSDAGVLLVFEKKVENREIPSNIENWLNERKNYFKKRLYDPFLAFRQPEYRQRGQQQSMRKSRLAKAPISSAT